LTFLNDNSGFIWASEKNGYNQVFLYGMDGKEKVALTPGSFDVISLYGIDETNKKAYYLAAEKSPMEHQVFEVGLDGKNKRIMTETKGMNSAQFSSTFDYYVHNNSTINTPPTYTVKDRSGKSIRVIESNTTLTKNLENYIISNAEFFNFKTSEGVQLNGYMIKPKHFNTNRKYPVFMFQYSGPNSQQVTDGWKGSNYLWFQHLAEKGYIVVCVDPRGTGARGEEFRKQTYMQLGHYETIDQIESAKYLASLTYVDGSRIGIYGWSYGGYMSSLCILKGNDIFKAAIAVAPVINWKWYDTIYTERYMRTYKENIKGYDDNSPINFADRLKGKYLLIHGMADDNVHYQNAVEMSNALINTNKQFEALFYPNRNHGIGGGNARIHLFTKMTDFITSNL
jgi:dipeptidyl-peptidase 4